MTALLPVLVLLVAGSLIYCVLVLIAARNYLKTPAPVATKFMPITLMRPLFGADEGLAENLRSIFLQNYPDYEILLAVVSHTTAEAEIARQVMAEFPSIPATLIATGPSDRPNGKVFALERLLAHAWRPILVMSDSDIRTAPDMLRVLAAEMQDDGVDLVTCPYRAMAGASFWSRLEAMGMNAEFLGGVLVARFLSGMDFALGCTLAVRKEALERIGGFDALRDYLAEDFMMGKLIAQSGRRVVLSSHVIEHRIGSQPFRANFEHRMRWMRSTRRSRPWGYIGEVFTRPLPLALLLAGFFPAWWPLALAAVATRLAAAHVLVRKVLKGPTNSVFWCLLQLQDMTSLLCWICGFFGNTILWRGRRLWIQPDGKFSR